MSQKLVILCGDKHNNFTVIKELEKRSQQRQFLLQCVCGENRIKSPQEFLSHAKRPDMSCGCLKGSLISKAKTKHGMCKAGKRAPEYSCWSQMVTRCLNTNNHNYARYGGAGVVLHKPWKDFTTFLAHIGPQPASGGPYSIDRVVGALGYVPGNVRWATNKEQARNHSMKRTNKTGVTGVQLRDDRYVAEWRELIGKSRQKSFSINKYGKDEAFTLACKYRAKMIEVLNAQGAGYTETHGKPKEKPNE